MEPTRHARFLELRRKLFGRWPGRPSNLERLVFARAQAEMEARAAAEAPRLRMVLAGCILGGQAPRERQCTKRLRTRRCRNWAEPGRDRCHVHPRRLSDPPAR